MKSIEAEVQQMIRDRELKVEEIKLNVELSKVRRTWSELFHQTAKQSSKQPISI